jgi:hypothetical protein
MYSDASVPTERDAFFFFFPTIHFTAHTRQDPPTNNQGPHHRKGEDTNTNTRVTPPHSLTRQHVNTNDDSPDSRAFFFLDLLVF